MRLKIRMAQIVLTGVIALSATVGLNAESLLQNASFETNGVPKYWTLLTFAGEPIVSMDTKCKKTGHCSVRIEAIEDTLAAIQQKVDVEPYQPYVLKGWVKTDQLKLQADADLYGTILIIPVDEPDKTKTICGPNHKGTIDWTYIRIEFEGPPQGQVLITCCLCGSGMASGTVWFDGLELMSAAPAGTQPSDETPSTIGEPAQPAIKKRTPTIQVTADLLTDKPINPMIFGQFIESGFGRQVDGLWSEMLFNRSFEKIPPYKKAMWGWLDRRPEDDLSIESWYHSGYEENPWYVVGGNPSTRLEYATHEGFRHGTRAGRVINDLSGKLAWLAQDGLYLRKNVTYRLRGSLRIGGPASRRTDQFNVTVGLYPEKDLNQAIVEETIASVTSKWKNFETVLVNSMFEGRATFAIGVPAGSDLRVDDLSLQPTDHMDGWRREAVDAMKRVHPRVIRFPGGCFASFYHWRDGIGPRSARQPRQGEFWGGLEYNDVGTAEFVSLCQAVGAEPLLCVNMMTGSANEAADWVAYCNAPDSQPLGALRKQHGYADSFAVKYWELGNEPYRKYDTDEYARRCADFARAMKKVDPSIQTIMAGYGPYRNALPKMLDEAGALIDLVSDRSGDEQQLRRVLTLLGEYNAKNNRDIKLCNTEWLAPKQRMPYVPEDVNGPAEVSDYSLQDRQIRWRYAMNVAWQLLVFQRLGGDLVLANFNNLANTWGQNVLECPKEGIYLSAAGRVFELFSQSPAAWPLKVHSRQKFGEQVIQAAWDANKKKLVLVLLNYENAVLEVPFDLSGLTLKADWVDISTLHADSLTSFNSLTRPETIKINNTQKIYDSVAEFVLEVPPYSVMHAVLH